MVDLSLMGTVFDIQRFSVHDGPGIRTTVFMKGCPLRCRWCHNPEGLSKEKQLQFFKDKCIGCGNCGEKKTLSDAKNCPSSALTVCGKDVSVDEIIEEILKDKAFYEPNGGVTFSGGECLIQSDFVALALKEIKGLNIHTAIDTSGFVPFSNIEQTLDFCDLYLYDIKCFDSALHKEFTGVDNRLIIENLKLLSKKAKEIWVRIPLIPNFNDNQKEMEDIASFIKMLDSVKRVTLIPYHTLGVSKYETLGLSYEYSAGEKLKKAKIETFEDIFKARNLEVK